MRILMKAMMMVVVGSASLGCGPVTNQAADTVEDSSGSTGTAGDTASDSTTTTTATDGSTGDNVEGP